MNKANFKCEDMVFVYGTNSQLDGQVCEIIGKSIVYIIDFYIISLQTPIESDGFLHKAASVPETNLKRA